MRLIHTSDWHLGRLLHGASLTEDQDEVLTRLLKIVDREKPDAVIVAGDIYDRSVPPHSAVSVLDRVVTSIVNDLNIPLLMIAGNHDSPDRLSFGASIFRNRGLYIFGNLEDSTQPVEIDDENGPVQYFGLPYAEPAVVREFLGRDDLHTHNEATSAMILELVSTRDKGKRSVLIAHAFAEGGEVSDSERTLTVGGAGTVDSSCLIDFDYVALGHLHRPQAVGGRERIHYSGSLLKYSFSEVGASRSVQLVEMDASGKCDVKAIPLKPKREMRVVEGEFDDILKKAKGDPGKKDYLKVILDDKAPIFDAMRRIREVYPNTMLLERAGLELSKLQHSGKDVRKMKDAQLFEAFFKDMTGELLTNEEKKLFADVVDELDLAEREAGS